MRTRLLLLLFAVLAATASTPRAGPAEPPPIARAEVWRMIFARPPAAAPAPPGSPAAAKIGLGHDLFRDPRLSGAGDRACAFCHDPARAFTDGRTRGLALDGSRLRRNTPGLLDVGSEQHFFWDGRAQSLEAQALVPLTGADEMAGSLDVVASRLARDPAMSARFREAFPDRADANDSVREQDVIEALVAYERTIASPPNRFDAWISGDTNALDASERRGFDLFVGKAGCVGCHGGWRFTDDGFHDIGLAGDDPGRGAIAGGVPGLAQFKTPSLRELLLTAPYMHDGSLPTLEAVVDHYAGNLTLRPSLDSNVVRDLKLTGAEKADLVAFLKSLSSTGARPDAE